MIRLLFTLLATAFVSSHSVDHINGASVQQDQMNGASVQQDPIGALLQNSCIWCPTSPAGPQAYVAFRGTFNYTATTQSPTTLLYLFADVRYMVWVDGVYISRGPGRFNPSSPDYDTLNITAALASSNVHTMTVLVHNYGSDAINGRIMYHSPGLTLTTINGGVSVFGTNATSSWVCSNSTEYLPSAMAWSSIPDTIDGRIADVRNWTSLHYNDASWSPAIPVNGSTWGFLNARALPMPAEELVPDLTLVGSNTLLNSVLPLNLSAGQSIIINVTRMAMVYLSMQFTTPSSGSTVDIQFALRYVNGATAEEYGVGTSYISHAGDNYVLGGDTWVGHYMILACTSGNVTISSLNLTQRLYPFQQVGSFASSDPFFGILWQRGINTLRSVTDDSYGSDARERNEWLQDPAQPNFVVTSGAFVATDNPSVSDPRLLKNLLRHAALTQRTDGRILATFPTDRGPSDCHYFIEDYAAQWIEALRWYYDSTADSAFVAWAWPVLEGQLSWFANHINASTGLLLAREYTSFDDPLAYITLEGTALNAFYYAALIDAAYLASSALNNASAAATLTANATAIGSAINTVLWNATEGSYNSGSLAGELLGPTAHAAMLALNRGVVPADRVNATQTFFLNTYTNPGAFHCCTNPDYRTMIAERAGINMTVSHYWVFHVLYGLDTVQGDVEVLNRLRIQWGEMIVSGGDGETLWESFFDSESDHNYGATPIYFLSSRVLGVRGWPERSASTTITTTTTSPTPIQHVLTLEPHLGDLLFANGTVVTPLGIVTVSWNRVVNPLVLTFQVTLPPNLAMLFLRLPDANASTLVVNGVETSPVTTEGRYAVTTWTPVTSGGVFTGSISMLIPPPAVVL